ncbi:hypothetical protein MLD38_009961 [Melastoma candidum]|uniref:Uncharacterized protein n=1 Tax=Melastoma candidum TaxID=119954 RepID=A0ACB9QYA0_9MYRT|nr:hypothetical protein MLD38_009961 [Melastoma candidum]
MVVTTLGRPPPPVRRGMYASFPSSSDVLPLPLPSDHCFVHRETVEGVGREVGAGRRLRLEGQVVWCFQDSSWGGRLQHFLDWVYQEILTDPSYDGQFVLMTHPLIGNTGVNFDDEESRQGFLAGLVIRSLRISTSNWRCTKELGNYLIERNIMGIYDVDMRAITRRLRQRGSLIGVLSTEQSKTDEELLGMSRSWDIVDPHMNGWIKQTPNGSSAPQAVTAFVLWCMTLGSNTIY